MALTVGQNSWASVAEADAYLGDRIGAADWFSLPVSPVAPGENAKESMLVSAFYWLSNSYSLPATLTNINVKNAQIEGALFLLDNYAEYEARRAAIASGVTDFRISKRAETFDPNSFSIPSNIDDMLSDYSSLGGVNIEFKGAYDG